MKGPLATLAVGAALGATLLVANVVAAETDDPPDQAQSRQSPAATPTPNASATPTPSPPPPSPSPVEASPPPTTPPPSPEQKTPPPDEKAETVTYVGYVDGGGTSVGIIVRGDEATAYVCDGKAEAWLKGTFSEGKLTLSGKGGVLNASVNGNEVRGSTTVAGNDFTFTLDEVAAPEGLYQIADTVVGGAEVKGGWIVLPDGTQVGVVTVNGESRTAPALDPATGSVTVDGQAMIAERLD